MVGINKWPKEDGDQNTVLKCGAWTTNIRAHMGAPKTTAHTKLKQLAEYTDAYS